MAGRDWRSPEAELYRRWYRTARWRKLRAAHLRREPLCRMCLERGILNDGSRTAAGEIQTDRRRRFLVCDHIEPHRGNPELFWSGPFQTLCPDHHDSAKQSEERRGYSTAVDADGWPTDARHPANRRG